MKLFENNEEDFLYYHNELGPAHPWLVTAYAESVPHPSGSAFAQELFESGHIPGDTDYRIYRDFGEVPGSSVQTSSAWQLVKPVRMMKEYIW